MTHASYHRPGQVGVIELNRPPANSYEIAFMRDLDAAISAAEADVDCRIVIVRSSVDGFFCGGADIKQFQANTPAQNMEMITLAHWTLSRPMLSRKLYIAELSGHALGGGLEIALACDLRFAAIGEFKFGLPEVTLGLLPGNGGTQRLTALVGPARALELMVTGETLGPEAAHREGIVTRIFPADSLRAETDAFADRLAGAATVAVERIKRAVYDGLLPVLQAGLAAERRHIAVLLETADAAEGFTAFVERRPAHFAGR